MLVHRGAGRLANPASPILAAAFVSAIGAVSCGKCGSTEASSDAQAEAAAAEARPAAPEAGSPPAASAVVEDAAAAPADASAHAAEPSDAGPSACRLAYGPAEQPFRGPAAIVVGPSELRLVANDAGKPRVFSVPLGAPPPSSAPPVTPPSPASFVGMRATPCEVAGRFAYCPANGSVYRTTLGTTDTKVVAKNQASTRIAAAALADGHAVVATLDARRTTEGVMMQAFVTLDEGETVRLSDDGAGATVVRLVARGERAVAMYLDARMSMVPVHARPMTLEKSADKPALTLAEDAVIFVGGPPERGIELAPAAAGKAFFALVPMSRETTEFGMAAIPVAEHPKDDVHPTWSLYPNGLDPAPVAATVTSGLAVDGGEGGASWVARVRPNEKMAGALRILELGKLDAKGTFTSLGAISTGKHITDVAIAADAYGSVWVVYGDSSATWLERRVCP